MLRFIQVHPKEQNQRPVFQYISCYGLSTNGNRASGCRANFNTSHVTVYHVVGRCYERLFLFQYISCYGLSPLEKDRKTPISLFQYISCYGLSRQVKEGEILLVVFQYISCYGLSQKITVQKNIVKYFNTSHVTVYLYRQVAILHRSRISIHLMLRFIASVYLATHVRS